MITTISTLTTCLKMLLIPAYYSTDFEVHRNWLAITYSLPVKKWYFENTSEWTLDYPPFFAWFEYFLTFFARFVDENMLDIKNLNYNSYRTVVFQRFSVILTDLVFYYGTYKCCKVFQKAWKTQIVLPILLIANCGLIMVDHIHFQYNGIMYGILLLSISEMYSNNYLKSAFWFTVLLNMKHIYLYAAPAYFIYLLKNYCMDKKTPLAAIKSSKCLLNTVKLGTIVLSIFGISFLPFYDQLPQVFSRLFPVKRGLCHAYWAPNMWALYNFADKILGVILSKFNPNFSKQRAIMTGGLVQEFEHTVLPNITPMITIITTLVTLMPCIFKLWRTKDKLDFIRCIVLCSLTSFLFGWHVHEKAILMAVIPLTLLAIMEAFDAKIFLLISTTGFYSLFPLLFPKSLLLIKTILLILYVTYSFHSLSKLFPLTLCKFSLPMLNVIESGYILGLILIYFYENFLHSLLDYDNKLPFLPLMLVSVYCSIGIVYSWGRYYIYFLVRKVPEKNRKKNK